MADKDAGTGSARRENPGGSTAPMRADVLAALAVVKVATGRQLYAMVRPGADSDKAVRAALNDLEKLKLVHSEGKTTHRQPPQDAADFAKTVAARAAAAKPGAVKRPPPTFKLWGLTAAGGTAAQQLLPGGREVGNLARGVGTSGARHAMAVNNTIAAFLKGGVAPGSPGGLGTVLSWTTEVAHDAPHKRRVQADAVLRAPEIGLPVLMLEVDRGTESTHVLARKFEYYAAYFAHRVKVPDPASRTGGTRMAPAWQVLYGSRVRREGYPPVAVVFSEGSTTVVNNRVQELAKLARTWWRGESHGEFTDYTTAIPIIATTLDMLQEYGPLDEVWLRLGHDGLQSLDQALANPDGKDAYWARRQAREEDERRAAELAAHERKNREREASRCPVCRRAADEYDRPFEASNGKTPCQPCVRAQEQADEQAAFQEMEQAAAATSAFLHQWTENTAPRHVLARQARDWGNELYAAWKARQNSVQRPAGAVPPISRPPQPQPCEAGRSVGPQTALQQLLAEVERRSGQPVPGTRTPDEPTPAGEPRRGRMVRRRDGTPVPPRNPQPADTTAARSARERRFHLIAEPLRSSLIARAEQEEREAAQAVQQEDGWS